MALTLLEAAKGVADPFKRGVIETFAAAGVLAVLPFENIPGTSITYYWEDTLPTVENRGYNEGYTEGTGVTTPMTANLAIFGGDLDVDKKLVKAYGEEKRTSQEAMKLRAMRLYFEKQFFKGDRSSAPKGIDGLQVITQHNVSNGGAALSLANLDTAIDTCLDPTHIFIHKSLYTRFRAAARSSSVGGNINYGPDEFGRQVLTYDGIPFVPVGKDNTNTDILGFTETGSTTSIYVVSLGDERLMGLQDDIPDVADLGEIDSKPVFRTRVDWMASVALYHPDACVRLSGITDAAITA